jgi:hypothetical protein
MNEYRPIITMTLHQRADYTAQVFDALAKCDGIKKYSMIISIDGDDKEVTRLAENFRGCSTFISYHDTPMGCGANTGYVINEGFYHTDYVIHIEDDTVPSPDTLRYMEWARQFESEPDCFSVTPYNRTTQQGNPGDVFRVRWFTPWIWATWRSRWDNMFSQWHKNWDSNLNTKVRGDMYSIKPVMSRVQNIGATRGVHVPSVSFHEHNHHVPVMLEENFTGQYVLLDGIREHEGP